ncbi:MAG: DUF6242 domain-containing protein [Alloprevotella sp.]
MKHFLTATAAVLFAILTSALFSCNADDEITDTVTVSNDCIVTGVTLGSIPREMHTTGYFGQDSTYSVGINGSYYLMHIDQLNNRIFNTDSLPVGTNAAKIVFSAFNMRGTATIRDLGTGSNVAFSASDTTDFTTPRLITVTSTDLSATRQYVVEVNVHKEEADTFVWKQTAAAQLATLSKMRLFAANGTLTLFAHNAAGKTLCLKASAAQPEAWEEHEANAGIADPRGIQRFKEAYYAIGSSGLLTSADGITWTTVAADAPLTALVAAGTTELAGMGEDGFYSSPDGAAWAKVANDAPAMLPKEDITSVLVPSLVDETYESLLLTGKNGVAPVVWKHDIDCTGGESFDWIYFPVTEENIYGCPLLSSPSLFRYDGASVLAGMDGEGTFAPLYVSRDNGRTWKTDEFKTPEISGATSVAAASDEQNYIWVVCAGQGEVWRGRVNRLGWKNEPGAFNKMPAR